MILVEIRFFNSFENIYWNGKTYKYKISNDIDINLLKHLKSSGEPICLIDNDNVTRQNAHLYDFKLNTDDKNLKEIVLINAKGKILFNKEYSINRKENNTMFDFKNMFGKITDNSVVVSTNGIGVKDKNGEYLTFNKGEITNISDFVLKDFPLYKIPVAISDIKPGDLIIHQRNYMFVEEIRPSTLVCVSVTASERKEIFPVKNIFGFNFYVKVINPFINFMGVPTNDNPFGNFPFFLMMSGQEDMKDMMPLMIFQMNGGNLNSNNMMFNMMMMREMSKIPSDENKKIDWMPFMMMMNMMNNKNNSCIKSEAENMKINCETLCCEAK